jgi:histidinol-phosphate/aromatic aminotransferase/cobyric acid decarboxylase-like protein
MTPPVSQRITGLTPVFHGSVSDTELASCGLMRSEVIDFSVNANPLGPSPAAVAAAASAPWSRYPDDAATELRYALAARDDVDATQVAVGNGSAELLWLLALAFVDAGDATLVVGPTFGEYARAVRIAGGHVYEHRADSANDFAVCPAAVIAEAQAAEARVVFVCNPNNPTGTLLSLCDLRELAASLPHSLLVIDEAYRQFVDAPPPTTELLVHGNVVLVRSLTKDYALTGLRLGYALATAPVCAALDAVRPPWSVNAVAQAAGLAALDDE